LAASLLLWSIAVVVAAPPKYTSFGLDPKSFASFGEQMGDPRFFKPERLSPYDLQLVSEQYKAYIRARVEDNLAYKLARRFDILKTLLPPEVAANEEQFYRILDAASLFTHMKSMWGLCVANGRNSDAPEAEDNLFVFVDFKADRIVSLDFSRPAQIFEETNAESFVLGAFGFGSFDDIRIPTQSLFGRNDRKHLEKDGFDDPRGDLYRPSWPLLGRGHGEEPHRTSCLQH
jgi:hypothetical protein